jgi:N6-adenosine-specific RNA methylase IME4
MAIEEITSMAIDGLAEDDAILWLWTTNAHLRFAFDVVEAWGFEYKSLLTWVKDRMGTGDWLRGQTEHCLLAIRGQPVFLNGSHPTFIQAARREHSRKPDEFYVMVEAACPGSKVELFAREPRAGWQAFGDQADLFAKR